jgi:hypothetical protein
MQMNLINTVEVVTRDLRPKANDALLEVGAAVAFAGLFLAFLI